MEIMENFTTTYLFTNHWINYWKIGLLEAFMLIFSFTVYASIHSYGIWMMIKGTGSGEFFNFSLFVCGIFFSVNSVLILLTKWFSCPPIIAIMQFLLGPAITGRPLFQCLICVERYLAVVHPVIFLKTKTLRYRVICCAVVWILTLGSSFLCMFTFFLCSFYVYIWFFSTQYFIFLSIQIFCLVSVLRALKQSGPGERRKDREDENPMKRRAFRIILLTTVSLAIAYVPYTITGLMAIFQQSFQILWSVSYMCFMLAGLVQPVHYLQRTGKLFCVAKQLHLCHFCQDQR